jgi:chorismate dehydratase
VSKVFISKKIISDNLESSVSSTMKIRISLVHYLNSAPLGWAFLHGPFQKQFEVFPASPAICADQLLKKEVDIGLIPSIEFQRIAGLRVIPDISISSLGKVRSILLVKPKGKKQVNSVALDASSRTSVALTKILLQKKLDLRPEYISHAPNLDLMLQRCDAALVIGDAALKVRLDDYVTMDLAEEWVRWQHKPFVCAFWACRSDSAIPDELTAVFQEAKTWGLRKRSEIAAVYSKLLDLPTPFLEQYLDQNINFDMGSEHVLGVEAFYNFARGMDLIPELKPLHFI